MSAKPLKILVVDDSNTIRRSAEIFLKQGGHEVLLAEDGFDLQRGKSLLLQISRKAVRTVRAYKALAASESCIDV